ncbi:MAG: AMP-binding protein [Alphaproteobacteria bacterium]|nr:AMP-binding protein [Alphaproteobacteria bacterium]
MSIIDRLQAVARRWPDAVAVEDRGQPLTYAVLVERAARLAATLRGCEAVAIDLPRSADQVIAVIACWWAGAAAVPLSEGLPQELKQQYLRQARVGAVVDRHSVAGDAPSPPVALREDTLAWIIFTSGSTGRAGAVEVPHRGVLNLLDAQRAAFGMGPEDRSLFLHAVGFDAAMSDLGCALLSGATLVIADIDGTPGGVLEALRRCRISTVDIPPATLQLLDPKDRPASLRTVIIGGEVCPTACVRAWAPAVRLFNVYGPTEATVCASLVRCTADWDRPWIGAPLPGVDFAVVDPALAPTPTGTPGELLIAGIGLAAGYRGDEARTARRFIHHGGRRWYRTGDRVVRQGDGWVFLGRVDRQVQLAGRRFEPEGVEAVLREHPAVREAAVVTHRSGLLVAFTDGDGLTEEASLRAWLAERLPRWQVPARVRWGSLPRTVNGKVDLTALQEAPLDTAAGPASLLLGLWRRHLGADLQEDVDLLGRGADSAMALQVSAAAERAGLVVPPGLWLSHATVASAERALRQVSDRMGAAEILQRVAVDDAPDLSARPAPSGPPRHVLLTGATGGLGRRLLDGLLARTDATLWCLVRAPDDAAAQARLPRHPRVRVLRGDLAVARLGLPPEVWSALAARVDTIVHAAARVHLLAPWAALAPCNVDGVRRLLHLAAEGAPKRLELISTLSVFVATDRNTGAVREDDDLTRTSAVWGGYAQTKWAAERLARASGLQALRVYRPGLLTGDSRTGAGGGLDFLGRFLRGVAQLGCVPEAALDLEVDISPIDRVTEAILDLALGAGPGTWHLANRVPARLSGLVDALRAEGVTVDEVDEAAFSARLGDAPTPDAAAAALALCRRLAPDRFQRLRGMDLFQATDVRFDMRQTEAALGRAVCAPPDAALLQRYAHVALSQEFLETM